MGSKMISYFFNGLSKLLMGLRGRSDENFSLLCRADKFKTRFEGKKNGPENFSSFSPAELVLNFAAEQIELNLLPDFPSDLPDSLVENTVARRQDAARRGAADDRVPGVLLLPDLHQRAVDGREHAAPHREVAADDGRARLHR
jgi:hypothetical protein